MNTKKLLVIVLTLITILIACLAIYLISTLTNGSVTPTPTPTPTLKPTVTITPVITTVVPTTAIPATPANAFTVSKIADMKCISGTVRDDFTVSIKVRNDTDQVKTVSFTDDLLSTFDTTKIVANSIKNNGRISGKTIIWDVITIPAKGTYALEYKLKSSVATSAMSSEYSILENKALIQSAKLTTPFILPICSAAIPSTALEIDQLAMITGGFILIAFGALFLKLNLHQKSGQFFWTHGLGKGVEMTKSASEYLRAISKRFVKWQKNRKLSQHERFEQDLIEKSDRN